MQKSNDGTNTNLNSITLTGTGLVRFEVTSTSTKIYKDDVLVEEYSDSVSDTAKFQFRLGAGNIADFHYKNVLIYPL